MILDYNNDLSVKPYKVKDKELITLFGNPKYGRKSREFFEKQKKGIKLAIKKTKKYSS